MLMFLFCFLLVVSFVNVFVIGVERRVFLFKQKTAYEMRISDGSSDVCSSDLITCGSIEVRGREMKTLALMAKAHIITDYKSERQIGSASCREGVCQYV